MGCTRKKNAKTTLFITYPTRYMDTNTNTGGIPGKTQEKETTKTVDIPPQVMFFDVEVIPQREVKEVSTVDETIGTMKNIIDYWDMPKDYQEIWQDRYSFYNKVDRMWLYPEFCRIICISVWYFMPNGDKKVYAIKGDDEKKILEEFAVIMSKANKIVWHNAIAFDAPCIEKRCFINGVKVPELIKSSETDSRSWLIKNRKPREMKIEDTILMWKGTGGISTSLELICLTLGIPSPKEKMKGSEVAVKYYASKSAQGIMDLFRQQIAEYCNGDVMATMDVYKRILSTY